MTDPQYHNELFKYFSNYNYKSRGEKNNQTDIWPYRYGSYAIYEANNDSKRFEVATFVNLTS
jgi:hypothetical protein